MDIKTTLATSNAGMRLIAQLRLFNTGDFEKLRAYLQAYYADKAFEDIALTTRMAELKAIYRVNGKVRVEQVVAVGKHEAMVVLVSEHGGVFLAQLTVEEDYPHKVNFFAQEKMDKVEEE